MIEQKKRGLPLSSEQLVLLADGAANGSIPETQLTALLMAVCFKGMNDKETAALTMAMAASGDMLKPQVGGTAVDKHSTGGVGDTTTPVAVPLAAACGVRILKMSGRGLGHTGGTIDKLESIPGFQTELSEEKIVEIVRTVGCCVVGQSHELAPADKCLYALRDETATVDSMPLIASSIMSKKLASGAQGLVLDVKTGSGALMKTLKRSVTLAQSMVSIGTFAGREAVALVTGMDEPLGTHVGNAPEIKEAIDILAGRAKGALYEVSLLLCEQLLLLSKQYTDKAQARRAVLDALESGKGLEKLRQMITAQGGDARVCDDTSLLPQAKYRYDVPAQKSGYLRMTNAEALGVAARELGAGRKVKTDPIDLAVGFVMHKRIGDRIQKGEPLCTVHANHMENKEDIIARITNAVRISPRACPPQKLLRAVVTKDGVTYY